MKVQIVASRFPPSVGPVVIDRDAIGQRVVAIVDGTGSWEAGDEEARAVAVSLDDLWSSKIPGSPEEVVRDVVASTHASDANLADESFGRAGFSLSVLLVRNEELFAVSCGTYAVLHVRDGLVTPLYRPRYWIDEQVESGTLTFKEAQTHQWRHVYAGPLVSRREDARCEQTGAIGTGLIVVATMELARHLQSLSAARWSVQSGAEIQDMVHDGAAHMRPLLLVDLDAA